MRLVLLFIAGILLSFYLSEVLSRIFKHFHHSVLGIAFVFLGLFSIFFGQYFISSPNSTLLSSFLIGAGLGMIAHHLLTRSFIISEKIEKDFVKRHDTFIERILEILPGAITWIALTSPIWLSFTLPFAVAYLILLADIYWLFSSFRTAILIFMGYKKMEYAKKQNWLTRLEKDFPHEWGKYYHLLVLPTYKEGLEVLTPAFDAIINANYPKDKIFLAVGFEERDDHLKIDSSVKYLEESAKKIGGVFTTIHPFGLPGEVPGPGTNRNFIVRNAVEEFKKSGINPNEVFVTTLDADFVIHYQLLAGALHKYLSTPERERDKRTYTGVFLYANNYWQAPTPMRVMATGTAFWQLSEMVGSDKYINFSSLSINMQSLLDIGLWIPDKVNDDSGFYWKAYYHFKTDYKVIPHFLPISADAVLDVSLLKTFQNQYLQLKRWAYGVEHMPFVVKQYFKNTDLDFWDKTDKLIFITWSYFKWGTLALFITFAGLFIPLINPAFSGSVVYYNLSIISSWILTIAFLGLFSTIYVNEKTAPKRPTNWSFIQRFWSYVQWVLVPIILISIATLPALDAQTSLMLGRYLEFRVTNKARTTN